MKHINTEYQKRLNTITRELLAKLKRQGHLSKSEANFLNLIRSMN
jgi:hypothetical protein